MADLNHLLDELEETQEQQEIEKEESDEDDEDDQQKELRRQARESMETAATEAMTVNTTMDWDDASETHNEDVPAALQEAVNAIAKGGEVDKEEEGTDQETEKSLYHQLHSQWEQEHRCPELLPYPQDMVTEIVEQLNQRKADLEDMLLGGSNNTNNDGNASIQLVQHQVMTSLYQVDVDRTEYVLKEWLQCRLAKLEAHPLYYGRMIKERQQAKDSDEQPRITSPEEQLYLAHYGGLWEDLLHTSILDRIQDAWTDLDQPHMIATPDSQNTFFFWNVLHDIGHGHDDDDDFDASLQGDCLVAKYKDMKRHYLEGNVDLLL